MDREVEAGIPFNDVMSLPENAAETVKKDLSFLVTYGTILLLCES